VPSILKEGAAFQSKSLLSEAGLGASPVSRVKGIMWQLQQAQGLLMFPEKNVL
jgi:hypothetical protein